MERRILIGALLVGMLVLGGIAFFALGQAGTITALTLSWVMLVGLAAVIVLITAMVGTYWAFDIKNPTQPLALPEGSIRSLIAFSLVLAFVCMAAFLYSGVGAPEMIERGKVERVPQAEIDDLKKKFT